MKLLVVPTEKNFISDLVDGYILPLERYSVSYSVKYNIDEINVFLEKGKKVFVVINKSIFNCEIPSLEQILIALDRMEIDGVFFYDLSILSIVRKLGLKLPLVWNQTHMVTNYNTINYYASKGVIGAVLANEITLEEMMEIRKKTDTKLFVNIIYYPVMSFSRRKLISNYSRISGQTCNLSNMVIHEKVSGENLIVREEKDGTSIFQGKIVNGFSALPTMISEKFDYGIVDLSNLSDGIENDALDVCLSAVREMLDKGSTNISRVSKLIGDYTGFLHKKTIYKVK